MRLWIAALGIALIGPSAAAHAQAASVGPSRVAVPAFDAHSGDDTSVSKATESWFRQTAGADYAAAYAAMMPGMEPRPFDEWMKDAADFAAKAGKLRAINILKISWYENPPGAAPGTYVTADVQNSYDNVAAQCGVLLWYKASGATGFVLMRTDIGNVDRREVVKMTPTDIVKVANQMHCPLPISAQ